MKKLLLLLALIASPLHAQTLTAEQEVDKAIVDINLSKNATARAEAALKRAKEKWPKPAPPVFTPTPSKVGEVQPIASGLALSTMIQPAAIPPSGEPAFRMICMPGHSLNDDPIVYPGQPGKAHPHRFFGNTKADAFSTYKSLRTIGDSTCMNVANRSAYWIPEMLDGKGNFVVPDYLVVYYKRLPKGDPGCAKAQATCVEMPEALRAIAGWNQLKPEIPASEQGGVDFKCVSGGHPVSGTFPDLVEVAKVCKVGQEIWGRVATPNCWDGKQLDSADHRSHLTRGGYGQIGVYHCPSTHPFLIPEYQLIAVWSIKEGDDPKLWTLSSDHMMPGGRPGATMHSDVYFAWEPAVQKMWEEHCLDKSLNCSAGVLGNGQQLKQTYPFSWVAVPHLVPVPAR